jgi:hypothetical protein
VAEVTHVLCPDLAVTHVFNPVVIMSMHILPQCPISVSLTEKTGTTREHDTIRARMGRKTQISSSSSRKTIFPVASAVASQPLG